MYLQQPTVGVTDFWKLNQEHNHAGSYLELVNGKIVERQVDEVCEHLMHQMFRRLEGHVRPRKLGKLTTHTGYYRPRDEYNVRVPDVSFVSFERTLPMTRQGFTPYMPDIAVLVCPPAAPIMEFAERGLYFLKNGSAIVWILHPASQSVDVCTRSPKKSFRVYKVNRGGSIGGSDILPGFTVEVGDLFAVTG